jgi:hypothetical protein
MHVEGIAYNKNVIKPLYGKIERDAKRKSIVLGDAYGLKTRYNILLCLYQENIAPSAGNLDAICGGLVNLLAYSHEIYVGEREDKVEPLDVMDFIYKEMYDVVITKNKTLVYAPYIMKLILAPQTDNPLTTTNIVVHKPVNPQRKASLGVFEEDFASSEDEEEGDASEKIQEVAPRSGPCMKFASNAIVPSSKVEIKENMKKLSWWQRYNICMNVDIDILNNNPPPSIRAEVYGETLSYKAWNDNSLVNWADFKDVTRSSTSRDKDPVDNADEDYVEPEDQEGQEYEASKKTRTPTRRIVGRIIAIFPFGVSMPKGEK